MTVKSILGLGRAELLSASGQNNSKFLKVETNKNFLKKWETQIKSKQFARFVLVQCPKTFKLKFTFLRFKLEGFHHYTFLP
jgi:hypothetical protein